MFRRYRVCLEGLAHLELQQVPERHWFRLFRLPLACQLGLADLWRLEDLELQLRPADRRRPVRRQHPGGQPRLAPLLDLGRPLSQPHRLHLAGP